MISITSKLQHGSLQDLLRRNGFKKVRGVNKWNNEDEKYVVNIVEKDRKFNVSQIPYTNISYVKDKGAIITADVMTIRLIAGDFLQGVEVTYAEAYWKLFFWLYGNLKDFKVPSIKYKKQKP